MEGKVGKGLSLIAVLALVAAIATVAARAQTRGMVVDNAQHKVVVFDADTDSVLGSVQIGAGEVTGDCSVTADQTLGFATDFNFRVWVIDLTATPPSLASGTNPIIISNHSEDTTISPDQKFLLVCDGSALEPISVIDIASRTQISTFSLGLNNDCNSVDVCSDGSVLVTSNNTGAVRRLTLDATGNLTNTGEVLGTGGIGNFGPNNAFCAPGSGAGIEVSRGLREIRSFTIPGLALGNLRVLTGTGFGISGEINPAGDRAFVRSNSGAVDVYGFDSITAALSAVPLTTIPIANTNTYFGIDQMALHPSGEKLYVPQPNALKVYDAASGALLTSITHPDIITPTGVCFPKGGPVVLTVAIDIKPESSQNTINLGSVGVVPVAILSSAEFDATSVNPETVTLAGAPVQQVGKNNKPLCHAADVNLDGLLDLFCQVVTAQLNLQPSDATAVLEGHTFDGTPIRGEDFVRIVPKK
jgi:WD40 repeat protein